MTIRRYPLISLGLIGVVTCGITSAAAFVQDERARACAEIGAALDELDGTESGSGLDRAVAASDACPDPDGAIAFYLARRLRDAGDLRAQTYYERAIRLGPDDPEHEIGYGDYLRIYRGPQQPLFPEAEAHYYAAIRKVAARSDVRHDELLAQIQRRLAALYEQDGVPLVSWGVVPGLRDQQEDRPLLFFSTQNRYARALDGFDQVDDVRDLTTEEKFAASRERLDRPLRRGEQRDLVHGRYQGETFNRLRLRYRALPAIDLFVDDVHADDAQVTNFNDVSHFNDVDVHRYGVGLERSFDLHPFLDLGVRAEYEHGAQRGLVEFQPSAKEVFDAVRLLAKASRFWGPDKINLELLYYYADITQRVTEPIDRHLAILAATLRYQQFTPATFKRKFDLRTNELFAGVAHETEQFGDVDVHRNDVFVGAAIRGLGWPKGRQSADGAGHAGPLDVEVQPTLFSGDQKGLDDHGLRVNRLSNSQYRTSVTVLYRVVDNENASTLGNMDGLGPAHLAFLEVVTPFAHDVAIDGPSDFESVRFGANLVAKFIVASSAERSSFFGATTLAEAGYRYQYYYRIGESQHLFNLALKIGF